MKTASLENTLEFVIKHGLCRQCGEVAGTLRCGCGSKGCEEIMCADCASEPGPARLFVDGKQRPIIAHGKVVSGGYAKLTREERQHVRLGTAYVVARGTHGGRWKVAVQRSSHIYWYDASKELAARLAGLAPPDPSADALKPLGKVLLLEQPAHHGKGKAASGGRGRA